MDLLGEHSLYAVCLYVIVWGEWIYSKRLRYVLYIMLVKSTLFGINIWGKIV